MFRTFWIVFVLLYSSCNAESDSTLLVNATPLNHSDTLDNEAGVDERETVNTNLNESPSPINENTVECNSTGNCPETSSVVLPTVVSQSSQGFSSANEAGNPEKLDSNSILTSDLNSSTSDLDEDNSSSMNHVLNQPLPTGYDSEGNELDSEVRFTKQYSASSTINPTAGLLMTSLTLMSSGENPTMKETSEPFGISTTQEEASTFKEKRADYREPFNLVYVDERDQTEKVTDNQSTGNYNGFSSAVENSASESTTSNGISGSDFYTQSVPERKFTTGPVSDSYSNNTAITTTKLDTDINGNELGLKATSMPDIALTSESRMESTSYLKTDSEILEGFGEGNRSYFITTDISDTENITEVPKDILTEMNVSKGIFTILYPDSSSQVVTSSIQNVTTIDVVVETEMPIEATTSDPDLYNETKLPDLNTETTTNIPDFSKEPKIPIVIPSTHGPIIANKTPKQLISPTTKGMKINETELSTIYVTETISHVLNHTTTESIPSSKVVLHINNLETTTPEYDSAKSTPFQSNESVEMSTSVTNVVSSVENTSTTLTPFSTTPNNLEIEDTTYVASTKSPSTMTDTTTTLFSSNEIGISTTTTSSKIDSSTTITQTETTPLNISHANITEISIPISDQPSPSTAFYMELNTDTKMTTIDHNTFPVTDSSISSNSSSTFFSFSHNQTLAPTPDSDVKTDLSTTLRSSPHHTQTDLHREGKHIPFSTQSDTIMSSVNGIIRFTSTRPPVTEADMKDIEADDWQQEHLDELSATEKNSLITAIIQVPHQNMNKEDADAKIKKIHGWLLHVLRKEFQNWTKDPFDDSDEHTSAIPFGNVSVIYILPTPESNYSNITLTFIIYNAWKNDTLPVDFVLGILNFYSRELKESINATTAHFYHGYLIEGNYMLSMILDKYGIIIFTISLAVVGVLFLVCLVIYYRKKTRRSVHCLANNKFQQNMLEAVGIDLTPAIIILQDEKSEKMGNGNKICDDEGWLVPITDIPQAEVNVPFVQDTKL